MNGIQGLIHINFLEGNHGMINGMEETYRDFLGQMGEEAFLEPYKAACRRVEEKLNRIKEEPLSAKLHIELRHRKAAWTK